MLFFFNEMIHLHKYLVVLMPEMIFFSLSIAGESLVSWKNTGLRLPKHLDNTKCPNPYLH